jgi:anti-anti-sigma factor
MSHREESMKAPPPVPLSRGVAVVYAGEYVNKLSGQRIERECLKKLEGGCHTLVINFKGTELVNSTGVSFLLSVIDMADQKGTRFVFSHVSSYIETLFELLGLKRFVAMIHGRDEVALGVHPNSETTS